MSDDELQGAPPADAVDADAVVEDAQPAGAVAETADVPAKTAEVNAESADVTAETAEVAEVAPEPAAAVAEPADADPRQLKKRGRPRAKLEQLEIGSEHTGKVVGLAKFGAFVDIGAVTDGLVHVTELSQKRVRQVEDAVAMGDEVEVWIKDVDLQAGRVSLSMRRRPTRPLAELSVGDVVSGTVTSATKYGVFVDIGAETEGLVHISEMSSGFVERPSDVAGSGDAVEVRVKEIDAARERISLSMIGLANDVGLEAAAESMQATQYAAGEYEDEGPVERMPTVVELALRRALGEMQDDADSGAEAASAPASGASDGPAAPDEIGGEAPVPDDSDTLGELYERMIAAYKAEKTQQG